MARNGEQKQRSKRWLQAALQGPGRPRSPHGTPCPRIGGLCALLLLAPLAACSGDASVLNLGASDPFNPGSGTAPADPNAGGASNGQSDNGDGGNTDPGDSNDGTGASVGPAVPGAPVYVLTQRNNVRRTGANLAETALTCQNVAGGTFQKLYNITVDAEVNAQPLYVGDVNVASQNVNVLLVASANNTIYAFNADTAWGGQPLWSKNLGVPIPLSDFPGETGFATAMGIVGTPVVDFASLTLYVVAATKIGSTADANANYAHHLHHLSLLDGNAVGASPVAVEAQALGTGVGADANGFVHLLHQANLQRAALLLTNGQLYVGFSAHGSATGAHGWLLSYSAESLAQTGAYATSPNSAQGGIGQGGQGPAADANGNVYVTTGLSQTGNALSERVGSLVKFVGGTGLVVADYFAPANWAALSSAGVDFGATGPLLLGGTQTSIQGDSNGTLYFANTQTLGQVAATDGALRLQVNLGAGTAFYSAPVYYNGAAGARAYAWAQGDVLKAWDVGSAALSATPVDSAGSPGQHGGILSISANGNQTGSGIVWATAPTSGATTDAVQPGALYAYDAANLGQQLFDSTANGRDKLGNLSRFAPATVANGRVYVATASGQVAVYGLPTAQ